MEIDESKVDEAVMAVLYLSLHDECRAWKGVDWDVLNRLHERKLIGNPVGRQKSVQFTPEGLLEAERCFHTLFARK
jgi:hypothetical protein